MTTHPKIPLLTEDLSVPLCVDLDGTLIHEDTTRTAFFAYVGWNPLKWVQVGLWFIYKRHAYMKQKLAERIDLSSYQWTFSQSVITMAAQEKKRGRPVYLVSATDMTFAKTVIAHSPCQTLFPEDHIMASQGKINYRARAKAALLTERFGAYNFVYIGNSTDDLYVWKAGQTPVVVTYRENDPLIAKLPLNKTGVIVLQER